MRDERQETRVTRETRKVEEARDEISDLWHEGK